MMNLTFTLGRVALVAMFIILGVDKLLNVDATAVMISKYFALPSAMKDTADQINATVGMSVERILAYALGVLEVLAGILIAFNVLTRTAALVLLIYTAVTIFFFYDFWAGGDGADKANKFSHALESLSIIGGLLILMALPRRIWIIERERLVPDDRHGIIHETEVRS